MNTKLMAIVCPEYLARHFNDAMIQILRKKTFHFLTPFSCKLTSLPNPFFTSISHHNTLDLKRHILTMNVSLETRLSIEQHSADPADASDTEKVSPLQLGSPAKLPPEIRNMIYRKMLAAKKPLRGVHQLVRPKKSIMIRKIPKVQDGVDSTILRVC